MGKEISLVITLKSGILEIPFNSLVQLDEFTKGYDNLLELSNFLIKVFDFNLDCNDVLDGYISYINDGKEDKLQLLFSNDCYDNDNLKELFKYYLKEDHTRIRHSNIKYMKYEPIVNYIKCREDISDSEIDMAVNSYLRNGYKVFRDIYFILKSSVYNKHIIRKKYKRDKYNNDRNLDEFRTSDSYLMHVIELVRLGRMEEDEAMEIIGSHDLDELTELSNKYHGIVDGVDPIEPVMQSEEVLFKTSILYSFDEVRKIAFKKNGKGKK